MSGSLRSSAWPYLEMYPPIRVRLLAQIPGGRYHQWIPHADIAISGRFTMTRVIEISEMLDWSEVTISEAQRFCAACRFDPTITSHRNRVADYEAKCLLRNSRPFQWLHRSPVYQTEALPLIRLLGRTTLAASPTRHVA